MKILISCLFSIIISLLFSSCSVFNSDTDKMSTIPHNSPPNWELNGNLPGAAIRY